jgi:hypothetical protein
MATIERTAYPRVPKVLATKDLQAYYTPQPDELEWARRSTRGERPRLGLLVLRKVFQLRVDSFEFRCFLKSTSFKMMKCAAYGDSSARSA